MRETPEVPHGGAGMLGLVVALTLVLVKAGEWAGRQLADGSPGEWLGVAVGALLAVVLAHLGQRSFARRPEAPAIPNGVPRKAWAARRR